MSRRRLAAAGTLAGLFLLGWVAPAAHAGPPTLAVSTPSSGATLASQPTVSGTASATSTGGRISGALQVAITSTAGHPGFSQTIPGWCGQSSCSFSIDVGNSGAPLAYNGQYRLSVQASESDPPVGTTQTSAWSGFFSLAIPPQAPSGLAAESSADGSSVIVSWQPNPEPDIVGYEVTRSPAGTASWPAAVSGTTFTDSDVSAGTTYTYQVSALRAGATPGSTVVSLPSAVSATPAVPAGDAGPGGTASAASGGQATRAAPASGPPAAGGSSGSASPLGTYGKAPAPPPRSEDLSGFDSLVQRTARSQPSNPSPAPSPAPAGSADGVAPGSDNPPVGPFSSGPGGLAGAQAAGPVTITYSQAYRSHDALVRDVAAVGLAALLLAVAAHLLWLRREIDASSGGGWG